MYSRTLSSIDIHKLNGTPLPPKEKIHLSISHQYATRQPTSDSNITNHIDHFSEVDIAHTSLLIIPLIGWSVLITSVLAAFFKARKRAQNSNFEQMQHPQSMQKYKDSIPCKQCCYFSHNSYIHCAVHPSKTLTVQAIDCSDYHSS